MDAATPPSHILGYTIRSRTRIYVSYITPICLALLVYLMQMASDLALGCQYIMQKEPGFGAGTLVLVFIPPILTFILVVSSKEQREGATSGRNKCFGLCVGLLKLLFFPFFVVYRFTKRLFWSVEGLYHDDDDVERMKCLAKAMQTSNIELYLLIQAYAQAAPQIVLQLYYMLAQDMFRNYETSTVQALSLVFSAIDLAAITTSYHRIESQRRVGRHYPWATTKQIESHQSRLEQNERLCSEAACKKRESERTIASFPESDKIMANFHARQRLESSPKVATHELHIRGEDEVDNDALETMETKALLHSGPTLGAGNATDDDKIEETRPKLRIQRPYQDLKHLDSIEIIDSVPLDPIEVLDSVPETPAPPPPPPATAPPSVPVLRARETDMRRLTRPFSQLETFKDMLLVNAQLYIKENVPRPPKLLINRLHDEEEKTENSPLLKPTTPLAKGTPLTPKDVVDFFFPKPTKIVNGIQQEDFAARTVAFFGWLAFITMRMLSLATFCIFYPRAFFIVMGIHYALMLAALALETRCRGSFSRTLFYLVLGYIYIFVLIEFRVSFKSLRLWYGCYLVLTLAENITMSAIWYANEEFESWWFGFIWEWIIYSGILFLATLLVYYCILRPKDVSIIVEDENNDNDNDNAVEQT
ncbi:uncharacterized protein Dwil_GK28276 [Drosophila willistoni]|uniref:XK-related protein n=1 Tax=Drosophila willistoni TaxID=7260 RepID=A0A0Q9WY11_DROWI|nr:uncharacterized protein LOC26530278 [Drosophila willistoni]KRG00313.1 uncharacterized protein Dwil_GK28276 [Drosophila willistoni]